MQIVIFFFHFSCGFTHFTSVHCQGNNSNFDLSFSSNIQHWSITTDVRLFSSKQHFKAKQAAHVWLHRANSVRARGETDDGNLRRQCGVERAVSVFPLRFAS